VEEEETTNRRNPIKYVVPNYSLSSAIYRLQLQVINMMKVKAIGLLTLGYLNRSHSFH